MAKNFYPVWLNIWENKAYRDAMSVNCTDFVFFIQPIRKLGTP